MFALLFAVAGIYGGKAPSVLKARNDFQNPGSESAAAQRQIERASGTEATPGVLVLVSSVPGGPGVSRVRAMLASESSIARISGPLESSEGKGGLLAVTLCSRTATRARRLKSSNHA